MDADRQIIRIGLNRPLLRGAMNFPFCLAPMVGLTHVAFRLLVRRYLPEGAVTIWPTEMLNSRRLPYQVLGETPETLRSEAESHLVPQILGNDEEHIRKTMQKLKLWSISGVDINMGCPVKKALKHNYGVALMGDASYAAEVVRMAVGDGELPVSVKLRAGHQNDAAFLVNFAQGLQQAGAEWLCLHPRLAAQKRRGHSDWSQIALVRENTDIAIIGNGDIQTADDALGMLRQTGCDAVMIGRALTARPWMFWQLGQQLGWPNPPGLTGEPPQTPEQEAKEYGDCLLYLLQLMKKYFPENLAMRRFKFFIRVSHVWLNFGHALEAQFSKCQNVDDLEGVVKAFFQSGSLRMMRTTTLRY